MKGLISASEASIASFALASAIMAVLAEFALDGERFLDQQALHDAALGAGLVGDQRHPQHFFGGVASLFGVLDHFDAAALAAPASVNLGLDDNAATESLRGLLGFGHRVG